MKLFKFVSSSESVLSMANGFFKFTPPHELNDPAELTDVLDRDAFIESLRAIRANGFTEEQFQWLRKQHALLMLLAPEQVKTPPPSCLADANRIVKSPFFDDLDRMEREYLRTIEVIDSKVGVLSLSERCDSLPMWAHYANLANGFVVVIEGLDGKFTGDGTGSLNHLKPVKYPEVLPGMTFDPATQDQLFFSKLQDWSYEREYRVVTALSCCTSSPDGKHYLRELEPNLVTEVIFGWRVNEQDRAELTQNLREVRPDIRLTCAKWRRGEFEYRSDCLKSGS